MSSDVRILTKEFNPIKLLKLVSPSDYEEIIHEWCESFLDKKYVRVENLAGAGDKGRDVVCTINKSTKEWDNYQCKHYDNPLSPTKIWIEIGKLLYFVFIDDYNSPNTYYFVSPSGVGTKLRDLLNNPNALKKGLVENWDKYCKKKITKSKDIVLNDDLNKFIDGFDFTIFEYVSPQEFIREFKETPYYTKRFGSLEKPRPLNETYPDTIQDGELIYIRKILAAYSDHLNNHLNDAAELKKYPDLKNHFERQRRNFYCAEYLCAHSREIYDPDLKHFENLKEDIYDGIIEEIENDAATGFERLKKVIKRAEQIQVTNNPIIKHTSVRDRQGLCHHLANEKEDVRWKK